MTQGPEPKYAPEEIHQKHVGPDYNVEKKQVKSKRRVVSAPRW
jgi:hypothetical protein